MRYTIPLISDEDIILDGPFPLSEQDWGHFMTVLDAMKPGLVREAAPQRRGGELTWARVRTVSASWRGSQSTRGAS